jgi:hypothetical protein
MRTLLDEILHHACVCKRGDGTELLVFINRDRTDASHKRAGACLGQTRSASAQTRLGGMRQLLDGNEDMANLGCHMGLYCAGADSLETKEW